MDVCNLRGGLRESAPEIHVPRPAHRP
jgi:hypothetical protein